MQKETHIVIGVFSLLCMIIVGFLFKNQYKKFTRYGYLGIFLFCLISNISIFFPGVALVSVLGGRLYNPWIVGMLAALGCIVGEILAYNIGAAGGAMIKGSNTYQVVENYMEKNGFLTIFFVTIIPNPVFNVVAGVAGSIEYPFYKFLIATFGGNWIQYSVLAYLSSLTKNLWKL